jgi:hypothetical protein
LEEPAEGKASASASDFMPIEVVAEGAASANVSDCLPKELSPKAKGAAKG